MSPLFPRLSQVEMTEIQSIICDPNFEFPQLRTDANGSLEWFDSALVSASFELVCANFCHLFTNRHEYHLKGVYAAVGFEKDEPGMQNNGYARTKVSEWLQTGCSILRAFFDFPDNDAAAVLFAGGLKPSVRKDPGWQTMLTLWSTFYNVETQAVAYLVDGIQLRANVSDFETGHDSDSEDGYVQIERKTKKVATGPKAEVKRGFKLVIDDELNPDGPLEDEISSTFPWRSSTIRLNDALVIIPEWWRKNKTSQQWELGAPEYIVRACDITDYTLDQLIKEGSLSRDAAMKIRKGVPGIHKNTELKNIYMLEPPEGSSAKRLPDEFEQAYQVAWIEAKYARIVKYIEERRNAVITKRKADLVRRLAISAVAASDLQFATGAFRFVEHCMKYFKVDDLTGLNKCIYGFSVANCATRRPAMSLEVYKIKSEKSRRHYWEGQADAVWNLYLQTEKGKATTRTRTIAEVLNKRYNDPERPRPAPARAALAAAVEHAADATAVPHTTTWDRLQTWATVAARIPRAAVEAVNEHAEAFVDANDPLPVPSDGVRGDPELLRMHEELNHRRNRRGRRAARATKNAAKNVWAKLNGRCREAAETIGSSCKAGAQAALSSVKSAYAAITGKITEVSQSFWNSVTSWWTGGAAATPANP